MEYNLFTYDNDKFSVNILTYNHLSIFESIFILFKLTILFSFSIKKQIGMTTRPNTSVIINTSGLILYA